MKNASPDLVRPQPQEVIKTTDDDTANLHQKLGEGLQALGHPNHQTVPAHEKPVLGAADLLEAAGNTVGARIEDALSDNEGLEKRVRVSAGRRFGRWVLDRFRRKQV